MRCSSLCVVQCTTRPVYSSREAAVKRSRPTRTLTLLGDEFQQSLSESSRMRYSIFICYILALYSNMVQISRLQRDRRLRVH